MSNFDYASTSKFRLHMWLKKRDWSAVYSVIRESSHFCGDESLFMRNCGAVDEHGNFPTHCLAAKAQTHTHVLAYVCVVLVVFNKNTLATRNKKGETPLDIARRSGACAEIIGLLSHTPEEADSLSWDMARVYAPVCYWTSEMNVWISRRSHTDAHKFLDEHDDELVREVLKYSNSELLRQLACNSQQYSDSLVFLALRMIHRQPLSLSALDQGHTAVEFAEHPHFNACQQIVKVLSLTPEHISSTPFPTLLRQHLPKQFVDDEIYSP